jgi:hypothetical protein
MLEVLAHVQHPNVADILNVYINDGKLYIVSKHIDVLMLDLKFKRLPLKE